MSRGTRKSRLLNPNAYDKMQNLKFECAKDLGRLDFVKENNDHYKGDLTAFENGSSGGPIGGEMVKRMISEYENKNSE
ncbi:MAG: alpha/beta-type small acid-soluble spore protein [Clostridiaceae bacterium]|nr:alpha/beta-type small acid-soluble spore protein [Clostridiaceae bacterium]